ncbi:MAG: hypothetical protein KDC85_09600 [Saprospiraceae bacterium]|nr:hypothetical protein [Saprospiraceae bacterium]MCB9322950.1 hypothetical protein [Lewinellaceae bacterium]
MSSKFQDQLRQSSTPFNGDRPEFIRKAKDRKYFGYTFDQTNGRHPLSMALDIFTKGGNRFGIYYMEISSPIMFNLGTNGSGQTITLRAGGRDIIIEGKNLSSVYEYILEQRLVWVKENDSSFVEAEEVDVVIERIRIEEE